MKRILIQQAPLNEPVRIEGFLERIRNTRHMAFLVVRDRSGSLQATIEKQQHPEWSSCWNRSRRSRSSLWRA